MFKCKELNKEFPSLEKMFAALKANKKEIIGLKKSTIKESDPVIYFLKSDEQTKSQPKELSYGDHIYPVINTINYFDSHNDVHLPGIWNKSASEQTGKTYYVINHDLAIGSVISYPKEVSIMIKQMKWSDLGKSGDGQTEALIYDAVLTEKTNKDFFLAVKSGEAIQNSIRMIYVNMDLAVNSKSTDFIEEKKLWDKVLPQVYNKKDAEEVGYFWAISEAKIYKEGSAVLFGSNDATPILTNEPKNTEPPSGTQSVSRHKDTDKYLNNLLSLTKTIR